MNSNDKMNSIGFSDADDYYDDEFFDLYEDFGDDDVETFGERMKRYGTDIPKLRIEFKKFITWYDGMLKLINAETRDKSLVCRALVKYIVPGALDDDAARLWCICMSEYSDFLFDTEDYSAEEEYVFYNFMPLNDDVERMMDKFRSELFYTNEFRKLTENITFAEKPCIECDFSEMLEAFSCENDPDDHIIKENITNAAERIVRSPELSQIIPVVFTALMTRYSKKMFETPGFDPNFTAALKYKEYIIDRDNGKNIYDLQRQLEWYRVLQQHFGFCDKKLCDAGFASISNAIRCELLEWEEYPMIERPLAAETEHRYFSCFPGGYLDNPYYSAKEIELNDLDSYEEFDMSLPRKRRVIEKAADYIAAHDEVSEKYIGMIKKDETDKCVSLIMEIINNSGIDNSFIRPEHVDLAYSCIMQEILQDIDRRVQSEMIAAAEIIMKWYE